MVKDIAQSNKGFVMILVCIAIVFFVIVIAGLTSQSFNEMNAVRISNYGIRAHHHALSALPYVIEESIDRIEQGGYDPANTSHVLANAAFSSSNPNVNATYTFTLIEDDLSNPEQGECPTPPFETLVPGPSEGHCPYVFDLDYEGQLSTAMPFQLILEAYDDDAPDIKGKVQAMYMLYWKPGAPDFGIYSDGPLNPRIVGDATIDGPVYAKGDLYLECIKNGDYSDPNNLPPPCTSTFNSTIEAFGNIHNWDMEHPTGDYLPYGIVDIKVQNSGIFRSMREYGDGQRNDNDIIYDHFTGSTPVYAHLWGSDATDRWDDGVADSAMGVPEIDLGLDPQASMWRYDPVDGGLITNSMAPDLLTYQGYLDINCVGTCTSINDVTFKINYWMLEGDGTLSFENRRSCVCNKDYCSPTNEDYCKVEHENMYDDLTSGTNPVINVVGFHNIREDDVIKSVAVDLKALNDAGGGVYWPANHVMTVNRSDIYQRGVTEAGWSNYPGQVHLFNGENLPTDFTVISDAIVGVVGDYNIGKEKTADYDSTPVEENIRRAAIIAEAYYQYSYGFSYPNNENALDRRVANCGTDNLCLINAAIISGHTDGKDNGGLLEDWSQIELKYVGSKLYLYENWLSDGYFYGDFAECLGMTCTNSKRAFEAPNIYTLEFDPRHFGAPVFPISASTIVAKRLMLNTRAY